MKKTLSSALDAYRQYRAVRNRSRAYRVLRYGLSSAVVAYVLLLNFPQVLFAHEVSYRNFRVYSREPLDGGVYALLDRVDAKLAASEVEAAGPRPRIFLTGSQGLYSFLSLYVERRSFAKGFPLLPPENVFVNRADVSRDLVFRDSTADAERSLSGVLAHEVAHFLTRRRLGYWRNVRAPSWKLEGYAEYVAGGSLLGPEEGARRWKESPADDSRYRYFKYYMLVGHLKEVRGLSFAEIFDRDIDARALEAEVLSGL
ncbi:MAG TPA: hypothetical protein VF736_05975 [Pyrinomonadaceae bacterium]|jgi:hypothetical protein